jgi:hypothetical protein
VALKKLTGGVEQMAQFQKEFEILSELNHPNIVQVMKESTEGEEILSWFDKLIYPQMPRFEEAQSRTEERQSAVVISFLNSMKYKLDGGGRSTK